MRSATFRLTDRVRLLLPAVAAVVMAYLVLRGVGSPGLVLLAAAAAFGVGLMLVLRDTRCGKPQRARLPRRDCGTPFTPPALATLSRAGTTGVVLVAASAACRNQLFVVTCRRHTTGTVK